MKHSKSPWIAKGRTVHADGVRISQSGFRGAASVQVERAYDEMLKANAKLIASAPTMLETLKRIRKDLIYEFSNTIYNANFTYIDKIIEEATDEPTR